MAQYELIMPKMGESIMEATILRWTKKEGDSIAVDETIVEIATDKVDSEIPSPVGGTITRLLFKENETAEVGKVIAVIATEAEEPVSGANSSTPVPSNAPNGQAPAAEPITMPASASPGTMPVASAQEKTEGKFFSPLVRSIAKQENIPFEELNLLQGSGAQGRVTKKDILAYLEDRKPQTRPQDQPAAPQPAPIPNGRSAENVEIIEMDRMRRLIADHMVLSKHTAPHVTSYVEVDVTNIVKWRENTKDAFQKRYGEKITFTPVFIEAVARSLKDFPMVNISLDGYKILVKKEIHIGMATALPSGNLIVPVIKHADRLNLAGLAQSVNDLARRARNNQLRPEEIQGGTFTVTNVGTFGNVMGTPIINQPQVAILATGAIRKKPAVVETPFGDLIAVRHMMFMSLSYDHRIVDGALGGTFLSRIGAYLEAFDPEREI
ncbi:MAG: dihydrolipoamide acetyltransferase family protein [Saprospiraceae bacterium]